MPRRSSRRAAAPPVRRSAPAPSFGSTTQRRNASTMAAAPTASTSSWFGRKSTPAPSGHEYHGPNYAAKPAAPVAPAASQGPGLFGQMASTAAGVAVGSAVGHTIGAGLTGLFGGSSSSQPAAAAPQEAALQAAPVADNTNTQMMPCEADAQNLARCLSDSNGDYQSCNYYVEMLKSCKAASQQYTA